MLAELLARPLCPWQERPGKYTDVVLDSRIRLDRNVMGCAFPHRASAPVLAEVLRLGQECIPAVDALGRGAYTYTALDALTPLARERLVLHHLSTPAHVQTVAQRGLLWRADGAAVVLLNEEDHLVLQTSAAGFDLQQVWDDAAQLDDALESRIDVSFRDDFGYLTASPSRTGTGLTAGVTIHIPAIVAMKRLNRIVQGVTKFGFAVASLYGEGQETVGNLFQITNQITLGVSETDILEQLQQIVLQIIQEERNCRTMLWSHDQARWRDRCCRAYGILAYATRLSEAEALRLGSELRLGIECDVIACDPLIQAALQQTIEPAFLQDEAAAQPLSEEDMLAARAKAVQRILREYAQEPPVLP